MFERKQVRCPNCGFEGPAKRIVKGSIIIEIALWLLLIIPGIIYTLWRMTSKYDACSACEWAHVVQISGTGGDSDDLDPDDIQNIAFIVIFLGVGFGIIIFVI